MRSFNPRIIPFVSVLSMTIIPGTVAAQEVCGGMGAPFQWIGGTEAESDLVTNDHFDTQIELGSQTPRGIRFMLSALSGVEITADSLTGGDPVVQLYDEDGTVVADDDDGGTELGSRLSVALEPGSYCMLARDYDASASQMRVQMTTMDVDQVSSRPQAANVTTCLPSDDAQLLDVSGDALAKGLTVTAPATQTSRYRFRLDDEKPLVITATNEAADPVLRLFDNDGQQLAENDDARGLNSEISMSDGLASGTYCIGLSALNDTAVPVSLTIKAFDAEMHAQQMYASGEASPPLGSSYPVAKLGTLDGVIRQDRNASANMFWFSFDLVDAGLVVIDGYGFGDADPIVTLFDGSGRPVGSNDDGGIDRSARLALRLQPGDYMVGIGRVGDSGGLLRLTMERFVSAQTSR